MSHGTGNKDLSYDGNPGLHNFQFCFSKSNSYLLQYIGLLQYCTQITYITVSSQSARFEDNNTH